MKGSLIIMPWHHGFRKTIGPVVVFFTGSSRSYRFKVFKIFAVIRFLSAKGKNGSEIHRELASVYGATCLAVCMVRRWIDQFKKGSADIPRSALLGSSM